MELEQNVTGVVGNHKEWQLESRIDSNEISVWLTENINIGLGCALLYLAAVFVGKKYMEGQPRYNLRQPMMIWSLLLAVFSIIGGIRSAIVMYHVGMDEGYRGLICSQRFYLGPITRFWGPVFVFSKILEYMDTAFIVLRKQKLIFLHWYHHLTVSLFSWWCYGSQAAGGGIFMTVNFIVHALMYSYYAVRAAGFKAPRPVAILITASQITQMVIGCFTVYYANLWRYDGDCKSSFELVLYGSVMYGSYLILFVHFFYVTYIRKQPIRIPKELQDPPLEKPEFKESVTKSSVTSSGAYNLRKRKD